MQSAIRKVRHWKRDAELNRLMTGRFGELDHPRSAVKIRQRICNRLCDVSKKFRSSAVRRRFPRDSNVGFDLGEGFTLGNDLAFLRQPGDYLVRLLGHFESGHDTDRHSLIRMNPICG